MNHAQTREAIDVMQAYIMGKPIECRCEKKEWTRLTVTEPYWNWQECEYRIAPEPMEIEVWMKPNTRTIHLVGNTFSSEEEMLASGWTTKKFREVL